MFSPPDFSKSNTMLFDSPPAAGHSGRLSKYSGDESQQNSTSRGTNETLGVTPFPIDEQLCSRVFDDDSKTVFAKHKNGADEHYTSLDNVKVSSFSFQIFGDDVEKKSEVKFKLPAISTMRSLKQPKI